MSKYTTELRYIIDEETAFPPSADSLALKNILANYPLENENFIDPLRKDGKNIRQVLNDKIIEHYYFMEVCYEPKRFLYRLKNRLDEIMPLYNQRYKSIDLDINPIDNVNMTETFTHTVEDTGKTTSTGTGNSTTTNTNNIDGFNVESDTPPTELNEDDIKANKYASRTSHNRDINSNKQNASSSNSGEVNLKGNKTETYTRKEFGSSKGYTFAQNIEQWRNIMINIEKEIINELQDLFMNCW